MEILLIIIVGIIMFILGQRFVVAKLILCSEESLVNFLKVLKSSRERWHKGDKE